MGNIHAEMYYGDTGVELHWGWFLNSISISICYFLIVMFCDYCSCCTWIVFRYLCQLFLDELLIWSITCQKVINYVHHNFYKLKLTYWNCLFCSSNSSKGKDIYYHRRKKKKLVIFTFQKMELVKFWHFCLNIDYWLIIKIVANWVSVKLLMYNYKSYNHSAQYCIFLS